MRTPLLAVILACLGPLAAPAAAQETEEPATAQEPLHPAVLLGRRAGSHLASRTVTPVVVITPEPASYAEALAHWTPTSFFPVLIDDGSWQAAEDIARFVRSFKPQRVVRWQSERGRSPAMRANRAVPGARALAEDALLRAWGVEGAPPDLTVALVDRWVELGHAPPGIVVADERDQAWTAALALAAGRGQPLMWTSLPKLQVNGALDPTEAQTLCDQIEMYCAGSRIAWKDLGDVIDAVTLCAALPGRVQTSASDFIATTDRLGRAADGSRWAWAGQVFGSEPAAAYRAMCSLFLDIRAAWIFDTYDSTEPWVRYDGGAAAAALRAVGLLAMLDDEPRNRLGDWRLRAERPVHADLVLINSSGNRAYFDLGPERGQPGDLPVLEVPAALHIVHSWSAVAPGRRNTIAGRWLERGVYAYAGSVHEPYLDAFVPTPLLASRLVAGAAFGAAVRTDARGLWRIAVLADPLLSYRAASPRTLDDLPLAGADSLEDAMKAAVTEARFGEAVGALALLGRDSDAARLVAALIRDRPEALDAETARAALFPLFRTGQDAEFLRAYGALAEEHAADGAAIDALWHVGRRVAREGGSQREAALTLLSSRVREDQREADIAELSAMGLGRR